MTWSFSSGKIEQNKGVFLCTKFITWWQWPICVMQACNPERRKESCSW